LPHRSASGRPGGQGMPTGRECTLGRPRESRRATTRTSVRPRGRGSRSRRPGRRRGRGPVCARRRELDRRGRLRRIGPRPGNKRRRGGGNVALPRMVSRPATQQPSDTHAQQEDPQPHRRGSGAAARERDGHPSGYLPSRSDRHHRRRVTAGSGRHDRRRAPGARRRRDQRGPAGPTAPIDGEVLLATLCTGFPRNLGHRHGGLRHEGHPFGRTAAGFSLMIPRSGPVSTRL